MKKETALLIGFLVLALLASCRPAAVDPEPTGSPAVDEEQDVEQAPGADEPALSTATPLPAGYPASEATDLPSADYPGPEATSMPQSAYPGGELVWLLRPLGRQCEDEASYEYQTLEEAVEALEGMGVAVESAQTVSLMVCQACNTCPTSEHFRVQILAEEVQMARSLGWNVEQ